MFDSSNACRYIHGIFHNRKKVYWRYLGLFLSKSKSLHMAGSFVILRSNRVWRKPHQNDHRVMDASLKSTSKRKLILAV